MHTWYLFYFSLPIALHAQRPPYAHVLCILILLLFLKKYFTIYREYENSIHRALNVFKYLPACAVSRKTLGLPSIRRTLAWLYGQVWNLSTHTTNTIVRLPKQQSQIKLMRWRILLHPLNVRCRAIANISCWTAWVCGLVPSMCSNTFLYN